MKRSIFNILSIENCQHNRAQPKTMTCKQVKLENFGVTKHNFMNIKTAQQTAECKILHNSCIISYEIMKCNLTI